MHTCGAVSNMKYISLILIAFALAGCASTQTVVGPDGTEHQLLTCTFMSSCYDKAAELCEGRYKIVSTSEAWNSSSTHLLIKCMNAAKMTRNLPIIPNSKRVVHNEYED